jgi:hypothetical protein
MKILLILFIPLFLFSKVHFAKVEPYETIVLKSAVSAQVTEAKLFLEGTSITSNIIVQLDDKMDKITLHSHKKSLLFINSMLKNNQNILSTLNDSLQRQKAYYRKLSNIISASKSQQDNAFYTYSNTKTQYFSTKEKIDSLKKQRLEINTQIAQLKDSIEKKHIKVYKKFLYKLMVNKGDYVTMGTPLAQLKDLTSAKLLLFLEDEELKNIKNKTIYINGQATKLKISKIWSVSDEKFISSYRTEIVIKNPKYKFSKLLKVEFR